jgi:hypothetical protein
MNHSYLDIWFVANIIPRVADFIQLLLNSYLRIWLIGNWSSFRIASALAQLVMMISCCKG